MYCSVLHNIEKYIQSIPYTAIVRLFYVKVKCAFEFINVATTSNMFKHRRDLSMIKAIHCEEILELKYYLYSIFIQYLYVIFIQYTLDPRHENIRNSSGTCVRVYQILTQRTFNDIPLRYSRLQFYNINTRINIQNLLYNSIY